MSRAATCGRRAGRCTRCLPQRKRPWLLASWASLRSVASATCSCGLWHTTSRTRRRGTAFPQAAPCARRLRSLAVTRTQLTLPATPCASTQTTTTLTAPSWRPLHVCVSTASPWPVSRTQSPPLSTRSTVLASSHRLLLGQLILAWCVAPVFWLLLCAVCAFCVFVLVFVCHSSSSLSPLSHLFAFVFHSLLLLLLLLLWLLLQPVCHLRRHVHAGQAH